MVLLFSLLLLLVIHSYYKSSYCIYSFFEFFIDIRTCLLFLFFREQSYPPYIAPMFADFHPKKEQLELIEISFMFQNVKSVVLLKNKNIITSFQFCDLKC